MTSVLYIQNDEHVHPGLLKTVLNEGGVRLDIVHAWSGAPVPTVPNGWAGIVVGGGGMGVYQSDEYPFLLVEIALIHAAYARKVPVLGLCLGAQLIAAALGGSVFPHHTKEIGFYDVHLAEAAKADPLLKGLPASFQPAHWHGDTFSLPIGATLLASSQITPNQLFRMGETLYGLQFHLETDYPALDEMVQTDQAWLSEHGISPSAFLEVGAERLPLVEPVGRAIFTRWIAMLK